MTSTFGVAPGPALADSLAQFASQWGFDPTTIELFQRDFSPEVQAIVIEEFKPNEYVNNVSGKMLAFARSVARRQGQDSALNDFAARWNLDDGTKQFLMTLSEDVRATVFKEFDPDPSTVDVARKLTTFARSVAAKGSGKGAPHANTLSFYSPVFQSKPPLRPPTFFSKRDSAIQSFVHRWGLDPGCVSTLEGLDENQLQRVLQDFEPRGNTKNVSGKLMAFVRTVVGTQEAPSIGGGKFVDPPWRKEASKLDSLEEIDFLARWNISNDSRAVAALSRLTPALKSRVMAEFLPARDTRDMGNKFCSFVTSVERAGPIHEAPSVLPPRYGADMAPVGSAPKGKGKGKGSATLPPHPGSFSNLEDFEAHFQLDDSARELLRSLSSTAQATVMTEFQPRDDVRDLNGKFTAFARSVASRIDGQGAKRPFEGGNGGLPPYVKRRFG